MKGDRKKMVVCEVSDHCLVYTRLLGGIYFSTLLSDVTDITISIICLHCRGHPPVCKMFAMLFTSLQVLAVAVIDLHVCVLAYNKTHAVSVISFFPASQNHYFIITGYLMKLLLTFCVNKFTRKQQNTGLLPVFRAEPQAQM